MIRKLIATDKDAAITVLRLVLGPVVLPREEQQQGPDKDASRLIGHA
jgi:hypothetical protein